MAVTIAVPPATDPAYLAFLRSSGVDESNLVGEAAARIDTLNRTIARRAPGYAEDKKFAMKDTADDWESRGLHASGGRLVAQARAASQIDRRQMEEGAQAGDSIASTSSGLVSDLAALRRRQAESELDTRLHIGTTTKPTFNGKAAF